MKDDHNKAEMISTTIAGQVESFIEVILVPHATATEKDNVEPQLVDTVEQKPISGPDGKLA